MKLLIEKFESKEPHYPNSYRDMVEKLSRKKEVSSSEGTDEEQFERGKAFGSFYECYMYATIIGMRANNPLPFNRSEGTKFLKIESWKPKQMVQYIFMSLLALADFEFEAIEDLTEEQANDKANELLYLMESYAKGGFEIMENKVKDDPSYFENTLNTVGFLKNEFNISIS